MAILMKLLAINIVANSFFGLSSSLTNIFSRLVILLSSASKSEGFRENSATSEPDTSAEHTSNKRIRKILNISGTAI